MICMQLYGATESHRTAQQLQETARARICGARRPNVTSTHRRPVGSCPPFQEGGAHARIQRTVHSCSFKHMQRHPKTFVKTTIQIKKAIICTPIIQIEFQYHHYIPYNEIFTTRAHLTDYIQMHSISETILFCSSIFILEQLFCLFSTQFLFPTRIFVFVF